MHGMIRLVNLLRLWNFYNAGFNVLWHYPWAILAIQTPQLDVYVTLPNMPSVYHFVLDDYAIHQTLIHAIRRGGELIYIIFIE